MIRLIAPYVILLILPIPHLAGIMPAPILSRNKTVHTSKGDVSILTDNGFGGTSWQVSDGAWMAIKVGQGPSKVFFSWNDPNYAWSARPLAPSRCPNDGLAHLVDYTLQTSSNSTDGADGDWKTAAEIKNNTVTARGHQIGFSDASWVKMEIARGKGSINEIEVHDISSGMEDTWFFPGTSISANAFKATPPDDNFADLINKAHPDFTPVTIRGAIACQSSGDFANNIENYISLAGNVRYWAIEQGTNDAWGGSNGNVASFKDNMQKVITACKKAGIKPIIARVIGTNKDAAGWQIHSDYLTCVDELIKKNNLIEGPDLFTWFSTHPKCLSNDGVHPSALGGAEIQRLWAEKMSALYPEKTGFRGLFHFTSHNSNQFAISRIPGGVFIQPPAAGIVSLFKADGSRILETMMPARGMALAPAAKGLLFLQYVSSQKQHMQSFVNF
jgi:lysophospholipase L1-like esterase